MGRDWSADEAFRRRRVNLCEWVLRLATLAQDLPPADSKSNQDAGGLCFATTLRYEGLNDAEEVYKSRRAGMRIYLWSALSIKDFEAEQINKATTDYTDFHGF
jgi:hypothetical protein